MSANASTINNQIENLVNISKENNDATESVAASIQYGVDEITNLQLVLKELDNSTLELMKRLSKLIIKIKVRIYLIFGYNTLNITIVKIIIKICL